jgi:DNA processing protein
MSEVLSQNTQAVLLLTAPLMGMGMGIGTGTAGRGDGSPDVLTHDEYNGLARQLHQAGVQPADLLASEAGQVLKGREHGFDEDRLDRLLGRGFQLSQAVERWQTRAIWVLSRADESYPKRLRTRLGQAAPVLLYGCGDRKLLSAGGLAVVGEGKADQALVEFTLSVGRTAASAGRTVIVGSVQSAGAAALRGALEEGGTAVCVFADNLEKAAMNREHRAGLLEERLVIVSPCDPLMRASADNTRQSNKALYALADAVLIVSMNVNKSVVSAGVLELLATPRHVPVYLRTGGETPKGLEALKAAGALPWPEPQGAAEWDAVLNDDAPDAPPPPGQGELPFEEPHQEG